MQKDGESVVEPRRRRRSRSRKKSRHTGRDKKIANAIYNLKWALAALAIGIPLLAIVLYLLSK